jgi:uncharacterized protein
MNRISSFFGRSNSASQHRNQKPYDKIRSYLDKIRVVDTHEHHFFDGSKTSREYGFFKDSFYFICDMVSAGMPLPEKDPLIMTKSADELWGTVGDYYNYSRATSYHAQLMYGFKKLYGIDKTYLTRKDIIDLERRVRANYQNYYNKWFDAAFRICNFEVMFVDQYWDHFNVDYDKAHFALVFRVNSLIEHISSAASDKKITDASLLKLLKSESVSVSTIDDYIATADMVLKLNLANDVVCLKNALAYERPIDFDYITYDEAKLLFIKKNPDESDSKKLQDFMFHWLIQKSIELNLPVQIHTGYLHHNNKQLDNGHPMKLLPLFLRYPGATFVIFHGGYPWTSEFVALAKHFKNVYVDIVWLPAISRTVAIQTLHEILDCIPFNKICWGGDMGSIEESAGALELAKEVVATVLSERIEKGWMQEDLAQEIARRIFRGNAIEIYNLETKRNIQKQVIPD